jgi:hypothetical protein
MKGKSVGLFGPRPCNSARAGVIGELVRIREGVVQIPRVSQSAADLADQMVIRCRTFFFLLLGCGMTRSSKYRQSLHSTRQAFSDR